jgi:molybdopterin converting factor small subunit
MRICVNLFANFRSGRFSLEWQEHEPGVRVIDIVEKLDIAAPEVGIVMVDGRRAELDDRLEDGARLALFPRIGGG